MKKYIVLTFVFIFAFGCKVQEAKDQGLNNDELTNQNVDPTPTVAVLDPPTSLPTSCRLEDLGLDTSLGAPTKINEAIDLINALPKPTSLACFLQALTKPLKVYITSSTLSVQPAVGGNISPRIFIMRSWLTMSIATAGVPSELLEFAQYYTSRSSYKGEIHFPVEAQLSYSAPFDRVDRGDGSSCRGCHLEETSDFIDGEMAYRSMALKPEAINDVSIFSLQQQLTQCDLISDYTRRCNIIRAVYDLATPIHKDFPSGTPTFYESLIPF